MGNKRVAIRMRSRLGPAGFLVFSAFFAALPAVGQNQGDGPPALLIISQPQADASKSEPFVDMSPYVARELKESGKYTPIIFKPTLASLHTPEANKALTPMDLVEPTERESARKIARFLNANFILYAGGRFTKNGVAGTADMEKLVGQQAWGAVFSEKMEAYRGKGKQPSPLEGILVHVANIMQKLTNAPSRISVAGPVTVKIPSNNPKDKKGSTKTEQPKTAAAKHDKPPDLVKDPVNEPEKTKVIDGAPPVLSVETKPKS